MIERKQYLERLITSKHNGLIKVITGIRRCGKSYLLDPIFINYLRDQGVDANHIIKIDLDERQYKDLLDADNLDRFVRNKIADERQYYLLLDEVQYVQDFESVLNGFLHIKNLDVYVAGSNSKFLSSDIATSLRGRGEQIRVFPLSFREYYDYTGGDKQSAFEEYITFGGMPFVLSKQSKVEKSIYLKELFELTYIRDIVERNRIQKNYILESILNVIASSIGSLTNPTKLSNTFKTLGEKSLSKNTIDQYLNYLCDSFLLQKVSRYDIKGKRYINNLSKYYYCDLGLRNSRLNFRQLETNHLIENAVYNYLESMGYNVDVGIIEKKESGKLKQLEVDFVCNQFDKRYYIQVAQNLDTREKTIQESKSLLSIPDNFEKIILVNTPTNPWLTEEGIKVINIVDFLLNNSTF